MLDMTNNALKEKVIKKNKYKLK